MNADKNNPDKLKDTPENPEISELPKGLTIIETNHHLYPRGLVASDKNNEHYVLKIKMESIIGILHKHV